MENLSGLSDRPTRHSQGQLPFGARSRLEEEFFAAGCEGDEDGTSRQVAAAPHLVYFSSGKGIRAPKGAAPE